MDFKAVARWIADRYMLPLNACDRDGRGDLLSSMERALRNAFEAGAMDERDRRRQSDIEASERE